MSEGSKDQEAFLDRWSRRKLEQAEEKPAPPQNAQAAASSVPAVPLPPVERLTPDSDFTPFMAANVDGATRRAALKKLFTDARFNLPDAFEAYSGDWTGGEPLPLEMLKQLNHAKKLLFDEPEKKVEAAAAVDAPKTLEPESKPKDPVGKQDA